jgi:hypothetical protein
VAEEELLQPEAQADGEDAGEAQQLHAGLLPAVAGGLPAARQSSASVSTSRLKRATSTPRAISSASSTTYSLALWPSAERCGRGRRGRRARAVQAMRGDVADDRREVGLDVPVELLEHAVERGEQRGVAAVVGVTQGVAAEKRQAGDERGGGADDGVGRVDHGFGKAAVVGDAEIDLREREVEAHARANVTGKRLGRTGRLPQQVVQAALDEPFSDQTLKPLCKATTPAVRLW